MGRADAVQRHHDGAGTHVVADGAGPRRGDGVVMGGDACGDLGLGATATGATPVATIPLPVIGITTPNIVQVSAGLDYAVALGSDGKVWGWGAHPGSRVSGRCSVTAVPVVAAGSGITQLSAGQDHVLALAGGTALAWGSNGAGALGIGSTAPVAGIVHVVGLSGVTQVASGNYSNLAVYSQPQGTALAAVTVLRLSPCQPKIQLDPCPGTFNFGEHRRRPVRQAGVSYDLHRCGNRIGDGAVGVSGTGRSDRERDDHDGETSCRCPELRRCCSTLAVR
jgi:hypothetical protein